MQKLGLIGLSQVFHRHATDSLRLWKQIPARQAAKRPGLLFWERRWGATGREDGMAGEQRPALDEETIAFAGRVFQMARAGDTVALGDLLAQGMPANLRNDKGDSLLMLASYNGHAEATRLLLAHGGDTALANDRGQTPLLGAAFKGDLAVALALLEGGAEVDAAGQEGRTALMLAAMFDRAEMVTLLLGRGADRHARDANGATAEELASAMGAQATPGLLRAAARRG